MTSLVPSRSTELSGKNLLAVSRAMADPSRPAPHRTRQERLTDLHHGATRQRVDVDQQREAAP